jgi:hypothetical protein
MKAVPLKLNLVVDGDQESTHPALVGNHTESRGVSDRGIAQKGSTVSQSLRWGRNGLPLKSLEFEMLPNREFLTLLMQLFMFNLSDFVLSFDSLPF